MYILGFAHHHPLLQGLGPYSTYIKKVEKEIKDMAKKVNDLCGMCRFTFYIRNQLVYITLYMRTILSVKLNICMDGITGIKESDTGLAAPSQWDLVSDKQMMQEEQPLQVQFQRFGLLFSFFGGI